MTIDIGSILATVAILVVLAFGVVIMLATMDDRWSDFKKIIYVLLSVTIVLIVMCRMV